MANLKVFISYRRDDLHGHAQALVGRIYDRLSAHYGGENVFMDVDTIPPGVDFVEHLSQAVEQTNVLLAVVGDRWTELMRERGDDDDFVRIEIEAALAQSIPVVPLLVGGAEMPKAGDLPLSLSPFVRRNAVPIDSGRDFNPHMTRLIADLDRYFGEGNAEAVAPIEEPASTPETPEPVLFSDDFDLGEVEEEPVEEKEESSDVFDFDVDEFEDLAEVGEEIVDVPEVEEAPKPIPDEVPIQSQDVQSTPVASAPSRRKISPIVVGLMILALVGTLLLVMQILQEPPVDLEAQAKMAESRELMDIAENGRPSNYTTSVGLDMIWCPPGSFTMGDDEEGTVKVTLTEGFWIGKTEVTQEQWQSLMGSNPSFLKSSDSNAPVDSVSWDEAMEFCRKLTEQDRTSGKLPNSWKYTLPTEAQWEYACRAGSTTAFSFGDDESELGDYAWFEENSDRKTHPVGQKKPNPWGLYDMHGNVSEWCYDWYDEYPSKEVTDPTGPKEQASDRVSRGGSWCNIARFCRSAGRYYWEPDLRGNFLGFRPVRSAE